jgi:hypothetical protein
MWQPMRAHAGRQKFIYLFIENYFNKLQGNVNKYRIRTF